MGVTSSFALIDPTPVNLERHRVLVGAWLASLGSENTRRAYRRNFIDFATWLDQSGIDLLAVGRVHVDVYRQTLQGAASTVARKLAAVSSFYSYAVSDGKAEANPVALVKRPRVDADASSTQGMTKEQAQELHRVAVADGRRSGALVALLLTSGVRIGEALGATTADLGHDAGHRVLMVTRKGGKRAKVALAPAAVAALEIYLGAAGASLELATSAPRPIFTTATGKRWAASEAFRTVQRLAKKAQIPGHVSPHSMRHTFATIYLDAGGTLRDLQDSMGHADTRTTRRYDRARGNLAKSASYTVAGALGL